MYLKDTYNSLTTSKDKSFLHNNFRCLEEFFLIEHKHSSPDTRVRFFNAFYCNIYKYSLNSRCSNNNLDLLFDYMIENLNLIELLEETTLYELFEEKTFIGIDYFKNNHLQNEKNIIKLIQKLPKSLVINYLKNSKLLCSFFLEDYTYVPWKCYYFIKIFPKANIDINAIPLSILCDTFISQKKIISWPRTKYSVKIIYFLIEVGYLFEELHINTHFNIFIKKIITHNQMRENCYRADNVLGRLCLGRSLKNDNIEDIFM